MKLFRTESPAVVDECQKFFRFLPVTYQIDIRTAKFLQKFMINANSKFFQAMAMLSQYMK